MAMKLNHARNMVKEFFELLAYFSSERLDPQEFGDYYDRVIQYQYQFAEQGDIHEFLKTIEGALPKEVEEKAMTWADQLKQEGLERGVILGKAELFEKALKKCGSEKAAADFLDINLEEFCRILEVKKQYYETTKH